MPVDPGTPTEPPPPPIGPEPEAVARFLEALRDTLPATSMERGCVEVVIGLVRAG